MGKREVDLKPGNEVPMYKYFFIGEVFTLVAIPVSKTSFAITLLRITTKAWQKWFIWFVIITVNIIYWLCALLLLVQCKPIAKNWDKELPGTCWEAGVQDHYAVFAGGKSS